MERRTVQLSATLGVGLYEALKARAAESGLSLSRYVAGRLRAEVEKKPHDTPPKPVSPKPASPAEGPVEEKRRKALAALAGNGELMFSKRKQARR